MNNSQDGSAAVTGSVTPSGAQPAAGPDAKGTPGNGPPGSAPNRPAKGFRLEVQQLLAGLQGAFPDQIAVVVSGGQATKAEAVQELQNILAFYAEVDGAEAALALARARLRTELLAAYPYVDAIKSAVMAFFGKGNPQLKQFGVAPNVRPPRSPAQHLAAAEKARQTRALRHTQGPKQKAKLQFQGAVTVTADVTAPKPGPEAAPAPVAAGAESASAAHST